MDNDLRIFKMGSFGNFFERPANNNCDYKKGRP